MRSSIGWLKRIVSGGRRDLLALFTPDALHQRNSLMRLAVAGVTVWGMMTAAVIGLTSLAALLFAIAVIYFLATQVLGLRVNIDPQAVVEQFYRQAGNRAN